MLLEVCWYTMAVKYMHHYCCLRNVLLYCIRPLLFPSALLQDMQEHNNTSKFITFQIKCAYLWGFLLCLRFVPAWILWSGLHIDITGSKNILDFTALFLFDSYFYTLWFMVILPIWAQHWLLSRLVIKCWGNYFGELTLPFVHYCHAYLKDKLGEYLEIAPLCTFGR